MINKWLMFEPFTEIRLKKNELLIYNTLNFKKIHTKNKLIINSIHELILRNMYCIEIKEEIYSTKVFKDFIQELKSTFSGDLIDKKICEVQPIIFPIFSGNIEKNFSQINNENILLEDRAELYSYMKHISLYINSYNTDMDFTWRENQFLTNINTGIKTDLDFKSIENLFQNIQLIDNIHFFDILGGNILKYEHFHSLIDLLYISNKIIIFHLTVNDLIDIEDKYKECFKYLIRKFNNKNILLYFHINFPSPFEAFYMNIFLMLNISKRSIFIFISENKEQLTEARNLINKYQLETYLLKPIYNRNNIDFFIEHVFLNENELELIELNSKQIMQRKFINSNFFGKLIIRNDGNVYSNFNNKPLGNLSNDSIEKMILYEVITDSLWFKTRENLTPCNECVYAHLCPPISNYELIIKKNNLCFKSE